MSPPAVSVIMPVYNAAPYLGEALRSVSNQTFEDFEIIAVDDGSTDESPDILRDHLTAEPRLRILSQENRGGAAARNTAIEHAQASLLALMDADDIALPHRFAVQVRCLREQPGIAVVGGGTRLVNAAGERLRDVYKPEGHDRIVEWLETRGIALHDPTVMMRRSAFEDVGGYREALVTAYDYDLWLRMVGRHRFENLRDLLMLYRLHDRQVTNEKLALTSFTTHVVRAAHRLRQRGLPDPLDEWDGTLDLSLLPRLQLSAFETSLLFASLVPGARPHPSHATEVDADRPELLERIWRTGLSGPVPRTGLSPLIDAVGHYWRLGQHTRSMAFAARLLGRVPLRVVREILRRNIRHRRERQVRQGLR